MKAAFARVLRSLEERARRGEKIYIVPTSRGLLFLAIVAAIFLMGIFYANNLALLLAFSLFGAFILILFATHAHLEKLALGRVVLNSSAQGLASIQIPAPSLLLNYELITNKGSLRAFPTDSPLRFCLSEAPRGSYECEHVKIWTEGERGFFRAWTYRRSPGKIYVYPRPLPTNTAEFDAVSDLVEGNTQFDQHRPYSVADSAKRIDWKVFARSEQLMIKSFQDPLQGLLSIDIAKMEGQKEEALSFMAYQVDQALRRNLGWELKLESVVLPPGKGIAHWRASMEALSEA